MSRRELIVTSRKRKYLIVASLLLSGCAVSWWGYQSRGRDADVTLQPGAEIVVLVHGLGRGPSSMEPMRAPLEAAGYDVRNWAYDSTSQTIETSSEQLSGFLSRLDDWPNVDRIHIVTHSLGGILVRNALATDKPERIGRVVMLAPPNRGSESARFWAPLAGKLIRPLGQLSNDPDSDVNQIAVPEGLAIGVIAAAQDGKVKVADTHLPGEADHLVVPGFHTFIMRREEVAEQVIHFFRHGSFEHSETEAAESGTVNRNSV